MTLCREDTQAAYAKHRALHDAGQWGAIAELFAEGGRYCEPYFGTMVGREAIREFLVKSMAGLEAWTFPIEWTVVDEGRVVSHWLNRLPGTRVDGGHFELPGLSAITYDDHGMITEQVDFYDRMKVLQVVAEARSRVVEHAVAGIGRVGRSVVMGTHWLVAKTSAGVR